MRRFDTDRARRDLADRVRNVRQFVIVQAAPAAHAALDRGEAVDHQAERAMHGVERVLGAGDIVLEFDDAGRIVLAQATAAFVGPHLLDVDQEIAEAAFDRFEMAEPRIRGVQPLHQRDDVIFEMADRAVTAGLLNLLDLVGQRLDQSFEPRRHRGAVLRPFGERVGERGDAMLETVERIAGAGANAVMLDALGQLLNLRGKPADGFVGGDMAGHVAQRGDGVLELAERRRVFLRDDQIDLVREAVHRLVEADQIFRRRQAAQRVAHFGQAVFDAGQRIAIDAANIAGLAALGDALGQALNLPLDGVDRLARHRLVERLTDVAEFGAQRIDGVLDAGAAQSLDLVGDLAQVFFEAGQVLARHRHHHRWRYVNLRMRRRIGLHLRRHRLLRRAAVERALTRGDFGDGAVEALRRHWRRHWRHHGRRHRRGGHHARDGGDLLDALVQPRDQLRQLRGLAALRLAGRCRPAGAGRLGRRVACELFDAAGDVVQPLMHAGQFVAIGIVIVAIG